MGTKFAIPESTAQMPTHVEGVRVWTVIDVKTLEPAYVSLIVKYWDEAEDLGQRLIEISKRKVLNNGGTQEDWDAIVTIASDPDNVDDSVEEMTLETWGGSVLWGCWYGMIAQ